MLFIIDKLGLFSVQDDLGELKARGRLDLSYKRFVESKTESFYTFFPPNGLEIDPSMEHAP
jgi:hypothetical protein